MCVCAGVLLTLVCVCVCVCHYFRSPNGAGLTHWPMYGAGGEYLEIGLKQQVGNHLRADRFTFWTETLPKKIQEKQQQRSDEL